jgi:hypothetical protein
VTRRLAAFLTAVAIGVAGCGGKNEEIGTEGPKPAAASRSGTQTGAATLRASLTALLTDDAYLTGVAISTGLTSGFDSGSFKAASATVERNSVDLSKAVQSVYGAAAAREFLELWRARAVLFADYAKARARGNAAAAAAAASALDGYRQRFGAFIADHNPNLPKAVVATDLESQVDAALAAIDAAVQKSPAVFARLHKAAGYVPATAEALAGGIVKQFPGRFNGAVDDGPATLRATLTALLEDHVYLAGIAIGTGVGQGLGSPAFKAAAGELDGNSIALSKTIGSVYGAMEAKRFLALWRAHIGFFVDYTKAKAARDRPAAEEALAKLDGYRKTFGAFIASINPNLSTTAVADSLKPHIDTLAAAIRAAVKKSPKTFDRLREAATHMPMTAGVLAAGFAKQFPDRFPAA